MDYETTARTSIQRNRSLTQSAAALIVKIIASAELWSRRNFGAFKRMAPAALLPASHHRPPEFHL